MQWSRPVRARSCIFGVFISPIYGKGKENVVPRLRKEVNGALRNEDAPCPAINIGAAFAISFSLSKVMDIGHFVAREEELVRRHDELGQGFRQTVVVYGLGGIGKAQLAAAYAKRYRDDYSAVFWLDARDETMLRRGFAREAEWILREYPSAVYVDDTIQSYKLDQVVR
jgi:hypothetical protein